MDNEINITYETLFEVLRREKTRDELQKLDPTFFDDVVNYLKEKVNALEHLKHKSDLFAVEEQKKAEKQLENTKKIIKELYERREKKIISMATDASRTFSTIIDTTAMLNKEKMFFDYLVELLNRFRKGILFSIMEAKPPEIEKPKQEEPGTKEAPAPAETPEDKLIRFTHSVPKFFGENLEEYGPFEKEDIAKLPTSVANILIGKQRAEEIANK